MAEFEELKLAVSITGVSEATAQIKQLRDVLKDISPSSSHGRGEIDVFKKNIELIGKGMESLFATLQRGPESLLRFARGFGAAGAAIGSFGLAMVGAVKAIDDFIEKQQMLARVSRETGFESAEIKIAAESLKKWGLGIEEVSAAMREYGEAARDLSFSNSELLKRAGGVAGEWRPFWLDAISKTKLDQAKGNANAALNDILTALRQFKASFSNEQQGIAAANEAARGLFKMPSLIPLIPTDFLFPKASPEQIAAQKEKEAQANAMKKVYDDLRIAAEHARDAVVGVFGPEVANIVEGFAIGVEALGKAVEFLDETIGRATAKSLFSLSRPTDTPRGGTGSWGDGEGGASHGASGSFQLGGVVPRTGLIFAHQGEIVIPAEMARAALDPQAQGIKQESLNNTRDARDLFKESVGSTRDLNRLLEDYIFYGGGKEGGGAGAGAGGAGGAGAAASTDGSTSSGTSGSSSVSSTSTGSGGHKEPEATGGAGDPRNKIALIRAEAIKNGVDPDIAVRVARSEGLAKFFGDGGRSGGAFQLYTGGGLGNTFQKETGLDPLDPKNEDESIRWAMKYVGRTKDWTPWHGARAVGVGPHQGFGDKQGYQFGGEVRETGSATVHEGEVVVGKTGNAAAIAKTGDADLQRGDVVIPKGPQGGPYAGRPFLNDPNNPILETARQVAVQTQGDEKAVKKYITSQGVNVDINWCGDFTAAAVKHSGMKPVQDYPVASNWRNFGQVVDAPRPGDIAIKKLGRGAGSKAYVKTGDVGSHVGIVGDTQAEGFTMVGANQLGLFKPRDYSDYEYRRPTAGMRTSDLLGRNAARRSVDEDHAADKPTTGKTTVNVAMGGAASNSHSLFKNVQINRNVQMMPATAGPKSPDPEHVGEQ